MSTLVGAQSPRDGVPFSGRTAAEVVSQLAYRVMWESKGSRSLQRNPLDSLPEGSLAHVAGCVDLPSVCGGRPSSPAQSSNDLAAENLERLAELSVIARTMGVSTSRWRWLGCAAIPPSPRPSCRRALESNGPRSGRRWPST